ncbi:MAG: hemolysin family protein [Bacteroidales bacterium]|jgi:CBS domain containing-hemolysin-like protein
MNGYLLIFLAILFSAFFSGMEIAFVTSNRLRIELDRKQGVFGSGIIRYFTQNPGQYISTMLIGNNISLVIYGLLMTKLLTPVIHPFIEPEVLTLILQTIISTGLILFVAEFLPKTIFLLNPNFFLQSLSTPTFFFFLLFYPVSKIALIASNFFIRIIFGIRSDEKRQADIVFSKVDLDHFVNLNRRTFNETESDSHNLKIFRNALDFSNVRLRECMVPRTEIEAVELNTPIEALSEKFIKTRFSRILVFNGTIDKITGYVELKDLFREPPDIVSIIRKLAVVPETMPANKLLALFVEEKKSVAVVVDEFGGTSGMITIEDVLEEIFGDIEDEHDTNEMIEKMIGSSEYIFSGRLEVDYLNEKYNLGLPEKDDYETLAGLILYLNGSIPKPNDIIRTGNIIIKVLKVTATRLDLVDLKIE